MYSDSSSTKFHDTWHMTFTLTLFSYVCDTSSTIMLCLCRSVCLCGSFNLKTADSEIARFDGKIVYYKVASHQFWKELSELKDVSRLKRIVDFHFMSSIARKTNVIWKNGFILHYEIWEHFTLCNFFYLPMFAFLFKCWIWSYMRCARAIFLFLACPVNRNYSVVCF